MESNFYLLTKRLFGNDGLVNSMSLSIGQIIAALSLTFVFAVLIYFVYKKTYQGLAFSRNFGLTLIVVSLITSVVVMAISGNLALSLGMVGALSIVRFRSAIKDPRDIAFLFWALTNGIVCGVLIYKLAIVSSILIAGIILIFHKYNNKVNGFLLVIIGEKIDTEGLNNLLESSCKMVQNKMETVSGGVQELHFMIKFKKDEKNVSNLSSQIEEKIKGVKKVTFVSYSGDVEGV